ncbi:hypothetical protein [Xanthobacter agilis]|uniref:hypothetical protein n=1 Tax=Xanthobacter agilis TaxID=47492 RepID=UPI00372CA3ED
MRVGSAKKRDRSEDAAERSPLSEFDVLDDDPDVDAGRASRLRQQVTSNARQATMDPADGLDL